MKPEITYDDFSKIELRVATILAAREHPNADKLMLLQIKVGDEEKQIVAGIRAITRPSNSWAGKSSWSTICKKPCCAAKSRTACCWPPATRPASCCFGPIESANRGRG